MKSYQQWLLQRLLLQRVENNVSSSYFLLNSKKCRDFLWKDKSLVKLFVDLSTDYTLQSTQHNLSDMQSNGYAGFSIAKEVF